MSRTVRFILVALWASSAATAQVRTGQYTGSGVTGRTISGLGFQPAIVWVRGDASTPTVLWFSSMPSGMARLMTAPLSGAEDLAGARITSVGPDGFTVSADPTVNSTGVVYSWSAWPLVPGKSAVGTYSGNGLDNRSITGLALRPDLVLVSSRSAGRLAFVMTGMARDTTSSFDATGQEGPDRLQALEADGFQLGTDVTVNAAGQTYDFAAFQADQADLFMGSYVADGVDNRRVAFAGTFVPELVLVKGVAARPTHHTAAMGPANDQSLGFMPGETSSTNQIQSLAAGSFTVGTSTKVGTSGTTYFFAAWRSLQAGPDAGANDAGANDGGTDAGEDAGPASDAGTARDAGTLLDAGSDPSSPAPEFHLRVGCDCSEMSGPLLVALAAFAWSSRRRIRPESHRISREQAP